MEKAIAIKGILRNDSYIIPRYQRNYAWGKAEISQLIKDIDEFFEGTTDKKYYLGSLVCSKREDGSFELLDGQQRHTTITLLNLVLKNWRYEIKDIVSEPNLKFDSRKKPQNYLEKLYQVKQDDFNKQINELNVTGTWTFKEAIEIIQEELIDKNIEEFANNLYNKVFLFRIEVPEDTDLNHYFEIMNNRGEQLEKHEIVKARLMGAIENDNEVEKIKEQNKFAAIWDACSDMSDYIYFKFNIETRKELFDNVGNITKNSFSEISINNESETEKDESLSDILENNNLPTDFPQEEKYSKEEYKSVIDFPNFILQVLKLKTQSISLDDKKLLEQFNQIKPDPKEFIFDLLKYRILFDKYVIKQDLADADESKQNWGIRKLNDANGGTIKTFNDDKENDDELVKLQTMLYYANSTNTYNNWLQEILKFDKIENLSDYTNKVFEIAKSRFRLCKDHNLLYPEISIFDLYFIDFLLWKLYKQEDKIDDSLKSLKENKIDKHEKLFNSFKFKQITSREHLAAQSNPSSVNIPPEELNGIGNLCLISTSQNSEGNKESPVDKRIRFSGDNGSLKRIIMFESFENDKWEKEQIQKHKEEIIALISTNII